MVLTCDFAVDLYMYKELCTAMYSRVAVRMKKTGGQ